MQTYESLYRTHHRFHIPVMGTGFTIDTPLRLGRFGISAVISLVDDLLIERVRKHYCKTLGLPFEAVTPSTLPDPRDARAERITAYLNLVQDTIDAQIAAIRALPFDEANEKSRYFDLLPETSPVKQLYRKRQAAPAAERASFEAELNAAILPGKVDVNIMTKLDRLPYGKDGLPLPSEFSDAKAALRGFAKSRARGNMVFSAGINPTLYGTLEQYPDFYPTQDENGVVHAPRKGVILKVTDYRSSMIQGRFLAKKGIEVREFRIESALNCGGHAFASDGFLMGPIVQEFADNRDKFPEMFEPLIEASFKKKGLEYPASRKNRRIDVTAQGGIGNHAEMRRMLDAETGYGLDATGWGSPFLLVPEATSLDEHTRKQLAEADEDDLYQSDASPLGILFNNMRSSSSEVWTHEQIAKGRPGSACPKGYLVSNTEFTEKPICTASKEYQGLKLKAMGYDAVPPLAGADTKLKYVYAKQCICDQLGNGALIEMGETQAKQPVSVCPGPNIAYFDRNYTLEEMVDHIYGRGPSLVPQDRPHMFAKDLRLYVDYFERLVNKHAAFADPTTDYLREFKANLEAGMRYYDPMLAASPIPGENLASLSAEIASQSVRLEELWLSVAPEAEREAGVTALAASTT
ncbi:MAG TPA: hypothetical protein VHO02_00010 [Fibrobacteria bacterium]|jgi:hypothetical protein|nr:hypothetical protein [Fibrobacteria bacterium]